MTDKDTCKTCWYHEGGYCRRRAPTQGNATKWPMASRDDWCGEHKQTQAKDDESHFAHTLGVTGT